MLKLDNNLLDELGLGSLPDDQKRAMLQHIYETLELRVGTNLANQMTDEQLAEFEKFIDEGGDANQDQALRWLETNLPNYKQVVNDVFEALKVEIKQMAPQLVVASQQQPAAPGPAPAPAYQDPYAGAPQPQPQPYAPASAPQSDQMYQQHGYGQPTPQMPPQQASQSPYQAAPGFNAPQQTPPPTAPAGGYQPAPQTFQPPQPPSQQPPAQPPYPPQQAA